MREIDEKDLDNVAGGGPGSQTPEDDSGIPDGGGGTAPRGSANPNAPGGTGDGAEGEGGGTGGGYSDPTG